jgi:uncharacterized membrane protein YdcZ (DUF606 family)
MALPLVPIVIGAGLLGSGGFVTGAATSNKLGSAISIASIVVGLFLVIILIQRFGLLRS